MGSEFLSLIDDLRNARDEIQATNRLYQEELQENTTARHSLKHNIKGVENALEHALTLLDGKDDSSVVARLKDVERHLQDHCDELDELRAYKKAQEEAEVKSLKKELKEAKAEPLWKKMLVQATGLILGLIFSAIGWFLYMIWNVTPHNHP